MYVQLSPAPQNIIPDSGSPLDTGPEQYKDAPIAVQVVAYRQMDEALINTAAVLDRIINGNE